MLPLYVSIASIEDTLFIDVFLVVYNEQHPVCLDVSVRSIRLYSLHIHVIRRSIDRSVLISDQHENDAICLDHRVQGNRIIHESLLGTDHRTTGSTMLLYQHSAHCSIARELFLRGNPQYRDVRPNVDLDLYNAAIIAVRKCLYSISPFTSCLL